MGIDEKLKRYEDVIKFSSTVNSSLDFDNILKLAKKEIKKIFNAELVFIYKFDDQQNCLISTSYNNEKIKFKSTVHNFVGACSHYTSVLHIQDVSGDIRYLRESHLVKEVSPLEMILCPMVIKGQILGVIQIVGSENQKFDSLDVELLEVTGNHLSLAMHNSILYEELNTSFFQVCESLTDAIMKKDAYTGGHTKRVCHFVDMIANEMNLPKSDLRDIKLAAILHDVGKIGIEDKILKKRAPLTELEYKIMKEHPRYGHEILGHIKGLQKVVEGIRYHHERPDGKGYPYGLEGDKIPLIARIISVADTFDAMISNRPYRKGLPPMEAYFEIIKYAGTQFDKEVVFAFVKGFEKTSMFRVGYKQLEKAS